MEHWSEVRTAYFVAQTGSISGAARALGVHRATILRHLDVIEQELGTKVFLRDAKGYQLTEVGEDLLRVAKLTNEQLSDFARRSKGRQGELRGEFILTSLDSISDLVMPAVKLFSRQHPKIRIRWLTGSELMKLEYGQAHVAIRSGEKPQDDDYVVLPFTPLSYGLYASEEYLRQYGAPVNEQDLAAHQFVTVDSAPERLAVVKWFNEVVPSEQVVCTSNNREILERAIIEGIGIGLMQCQSSPTSSNLRRVLPDLQWDFSNWIVTHGDLHRTEKIQAFLTILKSDEYKEAVATL
ncbi:LysR family transcriptional regulator [Reinekea thalattae]|uniref:LysR family transcriptional regulator n=1 Tax=Reinekea thalattae TaxID=2593301 RepID=A0A5C8Z988_9GAMM|nr:LysR family transcriptional regulator [Reinekea thalattae]TXR53839.1 LysR family transcriptional regulator [Reinekea thalattae]